MTSLEFSSCLYPRRVQAAAEAPTYPALGPVRNPLPSPTGIAPADEALQTKQGLWMILAHGPSHYILGSVASSRYRLYIDRFSARDRGPSACSASFTSSIVSLSVLIKCARTGSGRPPKRASRSSINRPCAASRLTEAVKM